MGEVHRADDTVKERTIALKLLPERLAGDAEFAARCRREARLAARLSDPHLVPIHDFGEIVVALVAQIAGALDTAQTMASSIETRSRRP